MPSAAWLLAAAVAATVHTGQCPTPTTCLEDTTKLSLTGVRFGQVVVVVLAVLVMSNEYGTRMIKTTLTATPRRGLVVAGKVAVLTAAILVAGLLGVLASLLIARTILARNGFTAANGYPPLSLADEPTLRAAVGSVLYLGLVALLSLGVGAIVRDTAGGITAVLALLFVFPMLAAFVDEPQWQTWIHRFSPMSAGLAVQSTTDLDRLPIGPWTGLGVMAAYAAAALVVGGALFRLRDA
jgi:ABC-2 type transport system permease protein